MSVRCFTLREPQTPPSDLGQEDEGRINGQHQLHRGEDGLNRGQHLHQEGKEQAGGGELLYHQGPEHHFSGLLHHHQWEDQDLSRWRLLQQRFHHHLFSESHLTQTQDALDEGGPRPGVGGTLHHRGDMDITAASTQAPLCRKRMEPAFGSVTC